VEAKREWFDKDYYDILGVASSASDKDIQSAYRKLARELHPDANPGDARAEERFKDVSAAYDVVGDADTRSKYDEVRTMGPGAMGGHSYAGGPGGFRFDVNDVGDLGDLLGGMFDGGNPFGGRSGPGARRGRDQEAQLRLSFDEAVDGVTTSVTISEGRGAGTRAIKMRIPAGVEDGQRIRLKDKGSPGTGGAPAGDLFVEVLVNDHPMFGRDGKHLTLELPVTFEEAALGSDVKVPTFRGEPVKLRLPAGTQPGRTFRVKGHGVAAEAGSGDLLVTVQLAVPTKLNKRQRDALETFSAASPDNPRSHLGL